MIFTLLFILECVCVWCVMCVCVWCVCGVCGICVVWCVCVWCVSAYVNACIRMTLRLSKKDKLGNRPKQSKKKVSQAGHKPATSTCWAYALSLSY